MKIFRRLKAKMHNVPFRKRMWYNHMAMIPKEERESKENSYIVIFDKDGKYIDCPNVGGMVTVYYYGKLYLYKVIGFKNDSRYRDWLYDGDWINPIVEFVKPYKPQKQ